MNVQKSHPHLPNTNAGPYSSNQQGNKGKSKEQYGLPSSFKSALSYASQSTRPTSIMATNINILAETSRSDLDYYNRNLMSV